MTLLRTRGYRFAPTSIRRHAPPVPGVFGIYGGKQWILIRAASNLRKELLTDHAILSRYYPITSPAFAFEVDLRNERFVRYQSIMRQLLQPKPTARTGASRFRQSAMERPAIGG